LVLGLEVSALFGRFSGPNGHFFAWFAYFPSILHLNPFLSWTDESGLDPEVAPWRSKHRLFNGMIDSSNVFLLLLGNFGFWAISWFL
jgi:hypothetical protein